MYFLWFTSWFDSEISMQCYVHKIIRLRLGFVVIYVHAVVCVAAYLVLTYYHTALRGLHTAPMYTNILM